MWSTSLSIFLAILTLGVINAEIKWTCSILEPHYQCYNVLIYIVGFFLECHKSKSTCASSQIHVFNFDFAALRTWKRMLVWRGGTCVLTFQVLGRGKVRRGNGGGVWGDIHMNFRSQSYSIFSNQTSINFLVYQSKFIIDNNLFWQRAF